MNNEQMEILERLYELKEQGALTEEEFSREKQKILAEDDISIPQKSTYAHNTQTPEFGKYKEKSLLFQIFSFKGRANRKEFGIFFVLYCLISIILGNTIGFNLITLVILWIIFISFIATTVRRLHDMNLSGWWVCTIFLYSLNRLLPELRPIILAIMFVLFLIVMLHPSHSERNKYGSVPASIEITQQVEKKTYFTDSTKENPAWFIFSMLIIGFVVGLVIIGTLILERGNYQ